MSRLDDLHSRQTIALRPWLICAMLLFALLLMFIPKLIRIRESARLAESRAFLECVREAQSEYYKSHGFYAKSLHELDLSRPKPTYFSVGSLKPGKTDELASGWSLTLTRFGKSVCYGQYQVTFNDEGFDVQASSVHADLMPIATRSQRFAGLFAFGSR